MKWRSKWEGRAECLGVGSALLSEADGEVRGCQEPGRFPLLTSSLPSPRWGCGPLTLQVVRLNLIHCVTVQFCQLFSCTPFPSELLLRIPRDSHLGEALRRCWYTSIPFVIMNWEILLTSHIYVPSTRT